MAIVDILIIFLALRCLPVPGFMTARFLALSPK